MKHRSFRVKFTLSVLFVAVLFWSSWAVIHIGFDWSTKGNKSDRKLLLSDMSSEQEFQCQNITSQAVVEGAIRRFVEAGVSIGKQRDRTGSNPWRYTSVANFMEINPDCCELLERIPGDYSIETQRLGAPHSNPPRLYAVRLAFKEWTSDERTFTQRTVVLVNCFGKAGTGPSFDLRRGIL
ncbi:hypothetical protein FHT86_001412 [Rhizobium sp. BK313]|uniref:hypothetical protein n=1 Tax=Rhizobium sp. BK313 TaxID=2587081 RepID=UPI00105D67AA|nr:hypothetical protein [Rhizobium sp. BK313]MBB3453156.1 hypothetical protein [Rhizobium sp. BK313]